MDRYWPSTLAYARARGLRASLEQFVDVAPRPNLMIFVSLDETERRRRLLARGDVTAADRETLTMTFRDHVVDDLRRSCDVEVDISGADPDEAAERVLRCIQRVW